MESPFLRDNIFIKFVYQVSRLVVEVSEMIKANVVAKYAIEQQEANIKKLAINTRSKIWFQTCIPAILMPFILIV